VHIVDPVRPKPLTPVLEPDLHGPGRHPELLRQLGPDRGTGHRVLVEGPPEHLHLVGVWPGTTSDIGGLALGAKEIGAGGA